MTKSKKIRLFHGTSVRNELSILSQGLKSRWEGVYLTDTAESAARWVGFRLRAQGEDEVLVIEVEVSPKSLVPGSDHSPVMHQIFGVGESLVHPKDIPASAIRSVQRWGTVKSEN